MRFGGLCLVAALACLAVPVAVADSGLRSGAVYGDCRAELGEALDLAAGAAGLRCDYVGSRAAGVELHRRGDGLGTGSASRPDFRPGGPDFTPSGLVASVRRPAAVTDGTASIAGVSTAATHPYTETRAWWFFQLELGWAEYVRTALALALVNGRYRPAWWPLASLATSSGASRYGADTPSGSVLAGADFIARLDSFSLFERYRDPDAAPAGLSCRDWSAISFAGALRGQHHLPPGSSAAERRGYHAPFFDLSVPSRAAGWDDATWGWVSTRAPSHVVRWLAPFGYTSWRVDRADGSATAAPAAFEAHLTELRREFCAILAHMHGYPIAADWSAAQAAAVDHTIRVAFACPVPAENLALHFGEPLPAAGLPGNGMPVSVWRSQLVGCLDHWLGYDWADVFGSDVRDVTMTSSSAEPYTVAAAAADGGRRLRHTLGMHPSVWARLCGSGATTCEANAAARAAGIVGTSTSGHLGFWRWLLGGSSYRGYWRVMLCGQQSLPAGRLFPGRIPSPVHVGWANAYASATSSSYVHHMALRWRPIVSGSAGATFSSAFPSAARRPYCTVPLAFVADSCPPGPFGATFRRQVYGQRLAAHEFGGHCG